MYLIQLYPSIKQFKCERSNADGTATQVDGVNVRYNFSGSVAPMHILGLLGDNNSAPRLANLNLNYFVPH